MSISCFQLLLHVITSSHDTILHWPFDRHATKYRLSKKSMSETTWGSLNIYLKFNIIICAKEKGNRIAAGSTSIYCSVDGRFEHVIWKSCRVKIRPCAKIEIIADVLVQRANWSPRLWRCEVSKSAAFRLYEVKYFMTKVPGIGGASIHCLSVFNTCNACIPGSCHRIVKHLKESTTHVRNKGRFAHLPARTATQFSIPMVRRG